MENISACELHRLFISKEISAEAICAHFLNRIQTLDKKIGAFTQVNEQALIDARALDEKRQQGKPLGLLAGIPIAIKDIIHVKGMKTTCGSKIMSDFVAPFDASVVRKIKEADGIIIGKTNLDEFAMGSSCELSAIQTTTNPWDVRLVPGGSSGGSAAAVAAGMAPIALGTDTGGSIRLPASFCGVCGMKATYGQVSRFGLVAFASSLDHIGPLAYACEDIERIMQVIGTPCSKDSTSLPNTSFTPISFQEKFPHGCTIGVPWSFLEALPQESRELFDRSLSHMKSLGGKIVNVDLSMLKYAIAVYCILSRAEASTNLARFDGVKYGLRSKQATTLDEIYDLSREEGFGDEVKRRILLGTFVLSSGFQDAYYKKAQKVRRLIINQFVQAFTTCDIIAMPASTGGAFLRGAKQDPLSMYLEDIYTVGADLAGLPAISLPAGFLTDGRPVGMQIIAPQRHDNAMVAVGNSFQQIVSYHKQRPVLT